ncbi:DinB family protein [Paenibacillus aurantius]|uniref:DinB family protein n=1 Tax=Paenibacillus aurantius TaxID=2918900 RepID=A0AA96L9M3_9BACL|nr:DinB family protein [Paenibacillus aurantius]WNQ09083.1 DinB family protein [Paenibacillus aurantius]
MNEPSKFARVILEQFTSTWDKDEWVVPLRRALEGVSAKEAAWVPPGSGNTIWQTVNHMSFYNERILGRLTGGALPETDTNTQTFGEPGNPEDEAGWKETTARAFELAGKIREALTTVTEEQLETIIGEGYTLRDSLTYWVTHDSFHGGQIVLLRKLQNHWPETIWP